ncbi:MAG: hypothetical protein J6J23_06285, partial [Clostridia bacterium]|nr:hypothetical protein [Clostridia bacterium]
MAKNKTSKEKIEKDLYKKSLKEQKSMAKLEKQENKKLRKAKVKEDRALEKKLKKEKAKLQRQEHFKAKIQKSLHAEWFKLDNAAIIYPSIKEENWTFVYRISAV